MDTGHSLIDPISKKPVLIVEYRAFNEMIPLQLRKKIYTLQLMKYLKTVM